MVAQNIEKEKTISMGGNRNLKIKKLTKKTLETTENLKQGNNSNEFLDEKNTESNNSCKNHTKKNSVQNKVKFDEETKFSKAVKTPKEKNLNFEFLFSVNEKKNLLISFTTLALVLLGCFLAYKFRMISINTYGLLIHEFDPWFNFRATEYLLNNGLKSFFQWYDYQSWYPIGRPVGTSIYPGMQLTSVALFHLFKFIGFPMSINDICCYVPVWFGIVASLLVGLITYECSMSKLSAACSVLIMAIIPAHVMRSMGGGYDNESIAVSTMLLTFYFWIRSLRTSSSWPFGILAGIAYIYMVATWGGYIFVLNMIAVHATILILSNNYTSNLFYSYVLFFVIGTMGAVLIPIVGSAPFRSLEQLAPLILFFGFFILQYCEIQRRRKKLNMFQVWNLRFQISFFILVVFSLLAMFVLIPKGYFIGVTHRVRSLFIQHTKTGNPLVDSVAEHQAASSRAYFQYLNICYYLTPFGFLFLLIKGRQSSTYFLISNTLLSFYFSFKMVRLIIFLGPAVSALSGIVIGKVLGWSILQITNSFTKEKTKGKIKNSAVALLKVFAFLNILGLIFQAKNFYQYSREMAEMLSNPTILFKAQLRNGSVITVSDYYDSYIWLKENTPEDARVMAWWDYGYQITGIANRTTIADGNTWNHEHIATLARCLVSPVDQAHDMIKHLADYVYVWSGGGGDDLAKLPHLFRIGNSVYNTICPGDTYCRGIGYIDHKGTPSPLMANSLLYKLHSAGISTSPPSQNLFQEVYQSQFGKVRIWKVINVDESSKKWISDPSNLKCEKDTPWICRGQYPPAMKKYISEMKMYST